ncbi:Hsp20/alpha crystallin family protein [Streptomyces sp. NPDC007369]|uniref:Hsp20/alpha crystallin family protein n=1 Tax=Streptomyces sp. NPDC007369 TaxID=3154589 RepID=UPI0033EF5B79
MGRFLEQPATASGLGGAWLPTAEEEESETAYTLKLELPGYPADSVGVRIEGDELVISGELSEEHHDKVLSRRQGGFTYRTCLPSGVDRERCGADLDDGVLTVTLPKGRRQQRRTIKVGRGRSTPEAAPGGSTDESGTLTPVEAHNTFVAGTAAASAEAHPGGGSTGDARGGAPPEAGS